MKKALMLGCVLAVGLPMAVLTKETVTKDLEAKASKRIKELLMKAYKKSSRSIDGATEESLLSFTKNFNEIVTNKNLKDDYGTSYADIAKAAQDVKKTLSGKEEATAFNALDKKEIRHQQLRIWAFLVKTVEDFLANKDNEDFFLSNEDLVLYASETAMLKKEAADISAMFKLMGIPPIEEPKPDSIFDLFNNRFTVAVKAIQALSERIEKKMIGKESLRDCNYLLLAITCRLIDNIDQLISLNNKLPGKFLERKNIIKAKTNPCELLRSNVYEKVSQDVKTFVYT